jgi:ApbE superfamily uncharacterized protein (UPF0280 family)
MSSTGAHAARLAEDRWHFQHGPIDLIIDLDSPEPIAATLVELAWERFQDILPGLVAELPALKRPASERRRVNSPVAQRMLRACAPFAGHRFITPMAAVAGAVADELIQIFDRPGVRRAAINNGGDIALRLEAGASLRIGICAQLNLLAQPEDSAIRRGGARAAGVSPLDAAFTVRADMPVRGIATSGWRGRSFSLGVADSVTVLAQDAAGADAAATLIGNAVDCDHPAIRRAPADALKDDTDLGDRLVTVDVPPLPPAAVAAALENGRAEAQRWLAAGAIHAAAIFLQGRMQLVTRDGQLLDAARGLERARSLDRAVA